METQRDTILNRLTRTPICGTDFQRMYIGRGAARIHELRQAGWDIRTRRCTNELHRHTTRQIEYYVEGTQ